MFFLGASRIHDRLTVWSAGTAALIATIITILYCVDVFARYVFNNPLLGVSSISGYMLGVIVFLAIPLVTKEGSHVTILILQDRMPPHVSLAFNRVIAGISALACFAVALISASEVGRQISEGILTDTEIVFPKWWISIFMPYAFLSAGLYFVRLAASGDPQHD